MNDSLEAASTDRATHADQQADKAGQTPTLGPMPRRDLAIWTGQVFPALRALLRWGYFSIDVEGAEHVPRSGPVIYAPNHAGWFTLDTLVGALVMAEQFGLERLPWAAVQDELLKTPRIGAFFEGIGGFPASWLKTPEALPPAIDVLCIYPEGTEGNCKSLLHAYQMRPWRPSFVRLAAARDASIVPLAIVGGEESMPSIAPIRFLKPLVGTLLPLPLSLLPLPTRWKFIFHEPVRVSSVEVGSTGGDSERQRQRVREITASIQERVQRTLDRETADRKLVRLSKVVKPWLR
ncbi:lysophospholipid acyltransferase family protein [Sorangium sp. So ce834]|uniref:lysophospholipid acyltransferase family protein n=1 Tax=Sorangium sp. So ce834 TaxID=3133321 RepID=UPI003F611F27